MGDYRVICGIFACCTRYNRLSLVLVTSSCDGVDTRKVHCESGGGSDDELNC